MGADTGNPVVLHRNLHPNRNGNNRHGHFLPRLLQCTDGESNDSATGEVSSHVESPFTWILIEFLFQFVGTQVFSFIIGIVGSALLLNYSTMDSSIQPILKYSLTRLIMTSNYRPSQRALALIQENVMKMFSMNEDQI